MSSESLVSVIIPTYNRAKLLPTAIQSVLGQTHKNVEVLVIDDGSTDETTEVIRPFEDKIVYLTSEHKGTAHARNLGMKAAAGKYIAFLDSDDTYLPYKLELQISFIEEHPEVGMVCTEFSGKYENGRIDKNHMRNYHSIWDRKGWVLSDVFAKQGEFSTKVYDGQITYYTGNLFKYVLLDSLIPTNTILFPKTIIKKIGYQNENYTTGQEYEYVVRICKYYRIAFLDIPTYVIFHHRSQSTEFLNYGSKNRRQRLKELSETNSPFFGSVLEWGYKDKDYYSKNKEAIDSRLAEIYLEYAVICLEINEAKKAREQLKKCLDYDSKRLKYRLFRLISFMPPLIIRIVLKILRKIQKWSLLIKIIKMRGLSQALFKVLPQK